MNIQIPARAIAIASVLALAVLSVPAIQVQAKPVSGNSSSGVCAVINPDTGAIETYPPGTRYVDKNGKKFVCGDDGWFHEVAAILAPSGSQASPIGTRPLTNAVAP